MLDLYKDNLEDIIDSNIDNKLPGKNNDLQLLKSSISTFWLGKIVLLLFKLFGNGSRVTSSKKNNLRLLLIGNL